MTDARHFLGMEPVGDELHWQLKVVPALATPGQFLFGGCGLGAALVALEGAAGRPTVWAAAHYLSFAPTDSQLDLAVTLAAVGGRITQARAVGRVGDSEILTVNAALGGPGPLAEEEVWVRPPMVPPPGECPPRRLPVPDSTSIFDRIDVRLARGRSFEELGRRRAAAEAKTGAGSGSGAAKGVGTGDPNSVLWARVPGHLEPSAATLAIIGDYVTGGVSQAIDHRAMSRSLDNTIRIVRLEPTEWILCDIHIQAVVDGYAQGVAYLWSQRGALLATASQSMSVRLWEI